MRVGRGGGPRGTTGTGGAKETGKTGKAEKASFKGMVTATGAAEDSTEKARQVRSWLLDELTGLAKDLKDGKASKEEATRKFVSLVVKDKMKGAKGVGIKAMEESISEMCEADPSFVSRLQTELAKLARS
ncbi:MAG: hypothetical protein AB2A00_34510 [Myxococcota bacterium]